MMCQIYSNIPSKTTATESRNHSHMMRFSKALDICSDCLKKLNFQHLRGALNLGAYWKLLQTVGHACSMHGQHCSVSTAPSNSQKPSR